MKLSIDLNEEVIDDLLKQIMLRDYYNLNDSISNFYEQYENENMKNIPDYKVTDHRNDIKWRDALEIALEYYLSPQEYKEKVLENV